MEEMSRGEGRVVLKFLDRGIPLSAGGVGIGLVLGLVLGLGLEREGWMALDWLVVRTCVVR